MKIDFTEAEALVIAQTLDAVLRAAAYDLNALKQDGYSVREVRAMERVIEKLYPLTKAGTTEAVK
jgi:hypothetical protein